MAGGVHTARTACAPTNDVSFTMYVAIGSMAVFRILTSYILGARMGMGAIGVWIGMVIDWIFLLLGLHLALEEREVARLLHGFQDLVGLRETKQTPVCC